MSKKLFILLLLVISIPTFAQIAIDSKSQDYISLSLEDIDTKLVNMTTEEHGNFAIINLPGATDALPGLPNTPSFGQWILIPNSTKPTLNINQGEAVVFDNIRLIPAQPQNIDKEGSVPLPFYFDENVYSQDRYFPENLAFMEPTKNKRGQDCTILWISPYQYNPVSKQLLFYPEMQIDINFMGSCQPLPNNLWNDNTINQLKSFGINGYEVVEYEESLQSTPTRDRDPGCDLLIITHESLISAADSLAQWKTLLGYETRVVTTAETGQTNIDIQSYIDNAYYSWDPAPSYILFLGDAELIPTWYINIHPTTDYGQGYTAADLYYADVAIPADLVADMGYGRIPVDNDVDAERVISRIIQYESNPPQLASYYNNASCAAYFQDAGGGYAERRFAKTSEDLRNFLTEKFYNVERLYKTDDQTYPLYWNTDYYVFENDTPGEAISEEIQKPQFPWDATNIDINNSINQGTFFLLHRDHGWRGGWGDPYYTSNHAANLMNQYLPIVYSINCETGWFDNETDQAECNTSNSDESFAESFFRNPNGGAVGVMGATRISYSGNNDRLVWGFIDALWPDFLEWCTADYPSHYPIYQMSDIMNFGKEYMMVNSSFGDEARTTTLEEFHWYGDPSMRIWTQQPQEFTISHEPSISLGDNTLQVNCDVEGATVTVVFENEIIGQSLIFSGSTTVSFDSVIEMGDLIISVSYPNYRPYISEIEIIPTGQYIICHDPEYIENGNYNDDIIQSLDTIDMFINLENIGILPSDELLSIVLNSESNFVTMVTDTIYTNTIGVNETILVENPFTFILNSGLSDSSLVDFTITIYSETDEWSYNQQLLVHAPIIEFNTYSVNVVDGDDQIIDPGEAALLQLSYLNSGSGWSYNLITTLYSSDPYITISGMDIIPEIEPGTSEQSTQTLEIYVSEDCPLDYYLQLGTMALDDVGSFLDHTFSIPIGILEYNFDIGIAFWEHDTLAIDYLDQWHLSDQRNFTEDGQFSLKCGAELEGETYLNNIFSAAYSPIFEIGNSTHLSFRHWMEVGTLANGFCWDGGIVELSVNGEEFFQITPEGGYPYLILNIPTFPFEPGTEVFAGSLDWEEVSFDLSGYSGDIQLRFVFGTSPTMYTMEGWYIDEIQIVSFTDSEEEEIIPVLTALHNNYPNPFNPTTNISFSLADEQNIQLNIFNVKGQKIVTLAEDILPAGNYNFRWDGKDKANNKVASGVYFYQLTTDKKTYSKKMIMMK